MSVRSFIHGVLHDWTPKGRDGGSSRVEKRQGVADHLYSQEAGDFFLGKTFRSDTGVHLKIGHKSQEHLILVARTRSGKGRDIIIPNVLAHPGSSLVIDPKGEAAMTCADSLVEKGHRVVVLDPMGVIEKKRGYGTGYEAGFNPLHAINPHDPDAPAEINELATILIHDEGAKETYWENMTRIFGAGALAYALTMGHADMRNIIPLANLGLCDRDKMTEIMEMMAEFEGAGNLGRLIRLGGSTGLLVMEKGDAAGYRSLRSLIATNFKWVDTERLATSLVARDRSFQMSDLKTEDALTVFAVLPEYRIESHGAWLRMIVNCAVNAISKTPDKPKVPVNVIIDEFGNLGELPAVRRAFAIGAGQGARITAVVQSFGQLEAVYKNIWEDMIANSAIVSLSVNDRKTVDYLSHRSGLTDALDKDGNPTGQKVPVMTHDNIARFTNASRENGILWPNGEGPVRFNLEHYDKAGMVGVDYDAHPDHASVHDFYEARRVKRKVRRKKEPAHVMIEDRKPKLLAAE